jgi:[ribosomal protein S18]-alanine N-acetyltransferase
MTADALQLQASISIRPAESRDVDAVAAIERESFTLPWSRRSFVDLVRSHQGVFLVATDPGGAVVGYAVLLVAGSESELTNVAVATVARGRGIGRLLLDAIVLRAQQRRASSMFLEVRESNLAAQALYASKGFRAVARRRRYYSQPVEDALVLRLDLS